MPRYQQVLPLTLKDFHVLQAAHRVVAAAALRRGTGARGLRSLLDSLLRDALYHVRGPALSFIPDLTFVSV